MADEAGADTEAVPARKIAPDDDDAGADVEVRSAAGSFWSELGWMGLAAPVLFGLVGAAMAWLGINAIQLYAYSSAHRSTWEARRVTSWGDAGFDVSGVTTGYAAVERTPRPAYDFEHSDNYKYARLLRLYHHDTWEVLVAAAVMLADFLFEFYGRRPPAEDRAKDVELARPSVGAAVGAPEANPEAPAKDVV